MQENTVPLERASSQQFPLSARIHSQTSGQQRSFGMDTTNNYLKRIGSFTQAAASNPKQKEMNLNIQTSDQISMNQSLFEKNYLILNDDEPSSIRYGVRVAPGPSFTLAQDAFEAGATHRKSRQSLIDPPPTAYKNSSLKKIYSSPLKNNDKNECPSKAELHMCLVCTPPDKKESKTLRSLISSKFSTLPTKNISSTDIRKISLQKSMQNKPTHKKKSISKYPITTTIKLEDETQKRRTFSLGSFTGYS